MVAAPEKSFHRARDRGCLIVTGRDRVSWLNGIVTADMRTAQPGRAAFGLLLNKQGKIQSDLWVAATEDALFVAPAASATATVCEMLDHMLIMEDAELTNAGAAHAWFVLAGSGATDAAREVAAGGGAYGVANLLHGAEAAVLVVPSDRATSVDEQLGATRKRLDEVAWDALRIAHGLPAFGVDYGSGDNPHEASLELRAVSWDKGCYLGQEVVCMQDMRGKVKRRVCRLSSPTKLAAGAEVLSAEGGERIGEITSVHVLPGGGSLALARLLAAKAEPGTCVQVAGEPVEVVADGRD